MIAGETPIAAATPTNDPSASHLAESATSKQRTANVLYGVAGGAAAAAGTLYLLEARF